LQADYIRYYHDIPRIVERAQACPTRNRSQAMSVDADDFKTLMRGVLDGSSEAADRLCRDYESAIRRVVRRRLPTRLRGRYDSLDFVNDVWLSFFTNPPADARFEDPEALTGYLAGIARNKINEARRQVSKPKYDLNREVSPDATDGCDALPGPEPTPSQIIGAEDEFRRMCRDRPPFHQQILQLLRQGMSYAEIARHLNTHEKTIWRLVRRIDPEVRRPCPPS
jgi:RNA polymerase sigma factor (sigma-70 family)